MTEKASNYHSGVILAIWSLKTTDEQGTEVD